MIDIFNTTFFITLIVLLGSVFITREIVTYKGIRSLKYIFTPTITLLITLICVFSLNGGTIDRFKLFIVIGLLLSLIADTLLMIEEVDLMKYGIIFFLLAHISYIISFTSFFTIQLWNIIPFIVVFGGIALVFKKIKGKTDGMDIPILVYSLILGAMVFTAFILLNLDGSINTVFIVSGAVLFLVSDVILAVNGFVKEIPRASVIVWSFYAPAQLLIALSCFR